jgi:Rho GDP-dissociation inhibitor
VNRTRKGIFGQTEELVIGSFAPASLPYKFVFPRYGFNEAPSGMMYRGSYKATDKFVDSDRNEHFSYDYKVQITR